MTEPGGQPMVQDHTPKQQFAAGLVLVGVLGILVAVSVLLAVLGTVASAQSLWTGGPAFALSGILLFLAAWWAFSLIRRKRKTGRFLATRSESMAKHAARFDNVGAGKPFWPQAGFVLVPLILSAVLIAFGIVLLRESFCICPGETWARPRIALLALAAGLFILPGILLFSVIRRKLKTGSFLMSQEELAKARAKRRKPPPLKTRILIAGFWCFSASLWTLTALKHQHSNHGDMYMPLFVAAVTWLAAFLWTWQVFRPTAACCAIPEPTEQLHVTLQPPID